MFDGAGPRCCQMVRVNESWAIWQRVWFRPCLCSVINQSSRVSNGKPCSSYKTKKLPSRFNTTSSYSWPSHGTSLSIIWDLKCTRQAFRFTQCPPRCGPYPLVEATDGGVEHRLDDAEYVRITFDHPAHDKMDNGEQRGPHIAAEMQDVGASDDHVTEIAEQEVGAEAERR